jgi:MOSC domain-containing protein YiiM
MSATIQSIQIGRLISEGNPQSRDIFDRHWTTGFYKQPVVGSGWYLRVIQAGELAVGQTLERRNRLVVWSN